MIHYRQYKDDDLEIIKHLHREGLSQYGVLLNEPTLDEDLNQISSAYMQSGGEFLVGEKEGEIVAMGALKRISTKTAEIKRMRVKPQYQRQGIGHQLLLQLVERARILGYSKLVLDTAATQLPAQKLYEKHGFKVVKRGMLFGLKTLFYEKDI